MITFNRIIGGEKKEIVVYSDLAEAASFGIHPIPWRQKKGSETSGDWVICDDGRVAQVMSMGPKGTYIKTTVGLTAFGPKGSLDAMDRIQKRAWSNFSSQTAYQKKFKRPAFKLFLRKMAFHRMLNRNPTPEEWRELGQLVYYKSRTPEATAKFTLRSPEVKDMVREEIKKILLENEITENEAVKMIKAGYAMAIKKEDPGNMLKAAFGIVDMLDMNPSKKSQMQLPPWSGSMADDPDLLRTIEEARSAVLPQHEEPIDTGSGEDYIQPVDEVYVDPKAYVDTLAKENSK